ncbi:MAG: NADH-quinone oxidoreductase subunit A [Planctomycetota bacterium]|jgi:NADH-quinone oxidoreductase subunit A|nr:NADH-quinone oxidoreductase subunit A [Planctomycetota bacterium]
MNLTDPVVIAGFVALFVAVGGAFLAVNLIVGWLVRPRQPNVEKLEVYECGEPTIGSSFVQFDLRFYVVALLFIIFDVEVALFFPWATVFGKAVELTDPALATATADGSLTPAANGLMRELGVSSPALPPADVLRESLGEKIAWATARAEAAGRPAPSPEQALGEFAVAETGGNLARTALVDMAVFYAVLLVGFAYVWYRGDLDWVRAVSAERASQPPARAA